MKYIKEFSSYKSEKEGFIKFTEEQFENEYENAVDLGRLEDFTSSEIIQFNKLKPPGKYFLKIYPVKSRTNKILNDEICINTYKESGGVSWPNNDIIRRITKIKDEWFLVEIAKGSTGFRYYKCDQFNSLLELINKTLEPGFQLRDI